MRVESGHQLEALGFLRFLASFQLAGALDADELVNFLVFVAQYVQTPELFKVLGFGDKITGFIRKLVEKKQHMEAIIFIYAFEQVNEFPPVPVLKDFLGHSEAEARTILKTGKWPLKHRCPWVLWKWFCIIDEASSSIGLVEFRHIFREANSVVDA
ncbi:hypothetical protein V6N13_148170 [Hibiscus sabdariffa]